MCPILENTNEMGNWMMYKIKDAKFVLEAACMTNCGEPRPKQCHCGSMLDSILARNKHVKEITGRFTAKAENSMAACRCYLGAAARAKFKYVQMDEPGSQGHCAKKREINKSKHSINHYVKVCTELIKRGCKNGFGRITMA